MKDNVRFYYKKNRLQQIRGFCATVQCNCSIRKASTILGIEHGAVSLQIKSLEKDLNTKLFERNKSNNMKLTKDGELFYQKAIIHLQGIDSLFEYFNSNLKSDIENNVINIACDSITATYILPKYLNLFKNKNSNFDKIKINITIDTIEKSFKNLINNSIDIALFCYLPIFDIPIEIQEENIHIYRNYVVNGNDKTYNYNDTIILIKNPSNCYILDSINLNINSRDPIILKEFSKNSLMTCLVPEIILSKNEYKNSNIIETNNFPKTYLSFFYLKNYIKKSNIERFIQIIKNKT